MGVIRFFIGKKSGFLPHYCFLHSSNGILEDGFNFEVKQQIPNTVLPRARECKMCLLKPPFAVLRLLLLLLFVFAQTEAAPHIFRSALQLQARDENAFNNSTLNTTTAHQGFEYAGWVSGPGNRGTLSLVFSCAFTLFLCVWTTVNVNIEPEGNYNDTLFRVFPVLGRRSGFVSTKSSRAVAHLLASKTVRKLGWSIVTLIVPEGIMGIAAYERRTAHRLRTEVKKLDEYDYFDTRLGYYAVMGGFIIPNEDMFTQNSGAEVFAASEPNLELEGGEAERGRGDFGKNTKATSSSSSRNKEEGNDRSEPISEPHNKQLTLTPHGVLQVAKWGKLPPITSAEVQDKSNASSLAKLLVFWQAFWMIVQVIGRTAHHLPVTLLELHTVLHAFCAVAMYFTWWAKPVDVECPTLVTGLTNEQYRELRDGAETENPTNPFAKVPGGAAGPQLQQNRNNSRQSEEENENENPSDRIYLTSRAGLGKLMYLYLSHEEDIFKSYFEIIAWGYRTLWASRRRMWREGISISVVGLIYGGLHLAAWNSSFPTRAEQILWQVSALATAIATSTFVLTLYLSVFFVRTSDSKWVGKICGIVIGIAVFPCFLFRVYLLVEGFLALRRLPVRSYEIAKWANMWPHLG